MMQRLEIMHDTDKGHGEDGGDYQNSDQVETPQLHIGIFMQSFPNRLTTSTLAFQDQNI